jgi:methionyl-tRNA formyltransferase
MNAIFCGFHSAALAALDLLRSRRWDVLPVVSGYREPIWAEQPRFRDGLQLRGLRFVTQDALLAAISEGAVPDWLAEYLPVELVVSYLFSERIRAPLLSLPTVAAINFHPGPLPEYGGAACYHFAILEKQTMYGVTAHFMDESFDTGDIILRKDFPLRWRTATAHDLRQIAQSHLLEALQDVISMVEAGQTLRGVKQVGTRFTTLKQAEAARRIDAADLGSRARMDLKARAFWDPPNDGAYIEVDGLRFTVIPTHKLRELKATQPTSKPSILVPRRKRLTGNATLDR